MAAMDLMTFGVKYDFSTGLWKCPWLATVRWKTDFRDFTYLLSRFYMGPNLSAEDQGSISFVQETVTVLHPQKHPQKARKSVSQLGHLMFHVLISLVLAHCSHVTAPVV